MEKMEKQKEEKKLTIEILKICCVRANVSNFRDITRGIMKNNDGYRTIQNKNELKQFKDAVENCNRERGKDLL